MLWTFLLIFISITIFISLVTFDDESPIFSWIIAVLVLAAVLSLLTIFIAMMIAVVVTVLFSFIF